MPATYTKPEPLTLAQVPQGVRDFEPRDYLSISDIHLSHKHTTTSEMLANLYALFDDFKDSSPLAKLKAVFFGGDIWHDTVAFNSNALHAFFPFWFALLKWASRNKIAIRVLAGTPRHDRDQDSTVDAIVKSSGIELDYKYVPALSIEYMEALRLHVLYVPDECRPTAQAIQDDTDKLLIEHGLTQVDIAIMHGMFPHQLGTIPLGPKVLDPVFFLSRVKHFINIGHIHRASVFDRILAQGSFDRISQGEEDPKGVFLLKEMTQGEWCPFFIENKGAKSYITIEALPTVEETFARIGRVTKDLRDGSRLLLRGPATHPLFKGFESVKERFNRFYWAKDPKSEKERVKDIRVVEPYQALPLNKNTITDVVSDEIRKDTELTLKESDRLAKILASLHE